VAFTLRVYYTRTMRGVCVYPPSSA